MPFGCRGLYSKGSKQGDGVYVFASSDTYAGQFFRDKMHGVGVYSFAGSGAYEGEVGQRTASSERVHDVLVLQLALEWLTAALCSRRPQRLAPTSS